MARIVLALDFEIEAQWLEAIVFAGHEIVERVIGSDALISAVEQHRPDLAVVQATPETLTTRSLGACDRSGVRTIAVTASTIERQTAIALGVIDRVDADADWQRVEQLLTGQGRPHAGELPLLQLDEQGRVTASLAETNWAPNPTAPPQPGSETKPIQKPGRHRTRRELRQRERTGAAAAPPYSASQPPKPATSQSAAPQRQHQPTLARHSSPSGRIIAVWGPHGAPGRSTIAINVAAAYAEQGRRVMLVDADSYGGAITTLLGITDSTPGLAAACRLAGAGSLDVGELSRLAIPAGQEAQVSVLGGLSNPARWPELRADRIEATLELCRTVTDVVVVDVGFNLETDEELASDFVAPRRNAATIAALANSDIVMAVADASPVGVSRYLRARLQLHEHLAPNTEVVAVANRVRQGGAGGEPASQVREALRRFGGIESVLMLPHDERAVARAQAAGLSVLEAAPRSRFARSIRALVEASVAVQ